MTEMKNFVRICLPVLLMIFYGFGFQSLNAQSQENKSEKVVVVFFNNGSKISGNLKSWDVGKEIVIDAEGIEMRIPQDRIKKVVEKGNKSKFKESIDYEDKGIFYRGRLQFITGNAGGRAHHRVGYGVTASAGYQFNQYLSTGIGTGYRQLIWDSGEKSIPLFLELSGYMNKNRVRPFYNLDIGYAFTWADEDLGIVESNGGAFVYPSVGLMFGREDFRYSFDVGYLFQDAFYSYGNNFDDRVRSEQTIRYQRLSIRFGVQF